MMYQLMKVSNRFIDKMNHKTTDYKEWLRLSVSNDAELRLIEKRPSVKNYLFSRTIHGAYYKIRIIKEEKTFQEEVDLYMSDHHARFIIDYLEEPVAQEDFEDKIMALELVEGQRYVYSEFRREMRVREFAEKDLADRSGNWVNKYKSYIAATRVIQDAGFFTVKYDVDSVNLISPRGTVILNMTFDELTYMILGDVLQIWPDNGRDLVIAPYATLCDFRETVSTEDLATICAMVKNAGTRSLFYAKESIGWITVYNYENEYVGRILRKNEFKATLKYMKD